MFSKNCRLLHATVVEISRTIKKQLKDIMQSSSTKCEEEHIKFSKTAKFQSGRPPQKTRGMEDISKSANKTANVWK